VEQADGERLRLETMEAYREFYGPLSAYTRRLTSDPSLAQDAVQETFLRLFVALMQGDVIQNRSAWLHRVAHNYICETVRSSVVRASVALNENEIETAQTAPETVATEWGDILEHLLAPREVECLRLRTEGFDYTEIAAQMAIRPGTVGTLLHRAVRKLRQGIQSKERSS
jgi:RNA polymerase sigma-70 factor (ECF subfamily)